MKDGIVDLNDVLVLLLRKEEAIVRLSDTLNKVIKENSELRQASTIEVVEEE